jgi:hypothetical protein
MTCRGEARRDRGLFDLRSFRETVQTRVLVAELQVAVEHERTQLHVVPQRVSDDDAAVGLRQRHETGPVRRREQQADPDQ